MSRYIDADAVCEMLEPFTDAFDDMEVTSAYVQTLILISNAPSIDIVRCKECKRRKKNGFCLEHNRYEKNDDGYCSYGEREGE